MAKSLGKEYKGNLLHILNSEVYRSTESERKVLKVELTNLIESTR